MKAGKLPLHERRARSVIREWEEKERDKIVAEAKKMLSDEVNEVIANRHNAIVMAVLFALRSELGFGKKRLLRLIRKIDENTDVIIDGKRGLDDLLAELERETGITEDDLKRIKER